MDQKKNLILLKGENKTLNVQSCHYSPKTGKYEVSFGGGRIYTYNQTSVEWMQDPKALNPKMYQISYEGKLLTQEWICQGGILHFNTALKKQRGVNPS